ncbi:hypothetical protein BH11PSE12_BH11PSE12_03070 [soil metagenome]
MNEKITQLLDQIAVLEEDLRNAVHEHEASVLYQIKGKRVEFEESVRQTHLSLKKSFFHWVVTYRPQNLITGPIIYSMIVPMAILDLFVSFYQASCFPIYKITKVQRRDYIVFDRQQLGYLNWIEKFHCTYCAYGNGLMAYVSEIVARTEEYFCPIKHARKVVATHAHYQRFLRYGDADDYEVKLEKIRVSMGEKKPSDQQ